MGAKENIMKYIHEHDADAADAEFIRQMMLKFDAE